MVDLRLGDSKSWCGYFGRNHPTLNGMIYCNWRWSWERNLCRIGGWWVWNTLHDIFEILTQMKSKSVWHETIVYSKFGNHVCLRSTSAYARRVVNIHSSIAATILALPTVCSYWANHWHCHLGGPQFREIYASKRNAMISTWWWLPFPWQEGQQQLGHLVATLTAGEKYKYTVAWGKSFLHPEGMPILPG